MTNFSSETSKTVPTNRIHPFGLDKHPNPIKIDVYSSTVHKEKSNISAWFENQIANPDYKLRNAILFAAGTFACAILGIANFVK